MTYAGAAVFVKTIGLTPLKTRLAVGIGEDKAHDFYRMSCDAILSILQETADLEPYWTVAEGEKAFQLWQGAQTMDQGSGGLGNRLSYVYDALLLKHDCAALLGADAPQISPALLSQGIELSRDGSFVIGPSSDGGFYVLLGSKPIPLDLWTSVPYSQSNTRELLLEKLQELAPVKFLPEHRDVDEKEDIPGLLEELSRLSEASTPQRRLESWLKTNI